VPILFGILFRSNATSAFMWAGLMTLVMGALVEIGEGISGRGNCRLRDLVPDSAGVLLGTTAVLLWRRARSWFPRTSIDDDTA
jgi:hypothetical protein